MRTYSYSAAVLALLLTGLLTGCDQVQEARNQANAVASLSRAAENMEQSLADAGKRQAERRQKGDTLAIPYQQLQQYLPTQIDGYQKAGDPEGSMINMTGMSYSTCSQEYKAGPDDNPRTLKVTIVDYNSAAGLYTAATAMVGAGFSMEDDQQKVQSADLGVGGIKALETYYKQDHRASLAAGVNDRFFLTVEATQQDDTELVRKVAKDLDLGKLAGL